MGFLDKVEIPPTMKKERFFLLFIEWKTPMPDPALNAAACAKSTRLVDMTCTLEQAQGNAVRRRLEFFPGCAIIADTIDGLILRADYFDAESLPLKWIDT
jgi:hypothetical protein